MFVIPSKSLKYILCSIYIFITLFILKSCEKTTSPINPSMILLTSEYVGVTEADIQLSIKNLELPVDFQLFRDDSLLMQGQLSTPNTLLTDTLLLPAHSYTYQVILIRETKRFLQSEKVGLTTMDTTSHEFQWETLTFGKSSRSLLNGVTIISDDNIWAVGEIYVDSTPSPPRYNAVHWDGSNWNLRRITVRFRNIEITPPGEGIFSLSEDDIWVTLGGAPAHWNGHNWIFYHLWDMGILNQNDGGVTNIWGLSSQKIYFGGGSGTLVYYDDGNWQKLESGTNDLINDIYGLHNVTENSVHVYCAVGDIYNSFEGEIIKIKPDLSIENFPWVENTQVSSIWRQNKHRIFACGKGIWIYNGKKWHEYKNFHEQLWFCIRANEVNDIFVVGDFGYILHFNGLSWRSFRIQDQNLLVSLDVKDNLVVAVSWTGGIIVGRRINS